jgi:penicillin amidase
MTATACVELQRDVLSLPGQTLRAVLLDRLDRRDPSGVPEVDPDVGLGLRVMRDWNGALERDSAGALLYERIWERLMERVIGAGISPGARAYLLGGSVHDLFPQGPFNTRLTPLLIAMLERGQTAPLGGSDPEARDQLLAQELAAAVAEIRAAHGEDPRRWRWGAVHKTRFEHPLASAVRALAPILSRGPFDSRGDNDTVWLSWKGATSGILAPVTSAFWRAVYDTADWAASLGGFAPGESGHPGSGHYADMVEDWLQGRPRKLLFGTQPAAGDRLVLRPEAPLTAAAPPSEEAS